MKWTTVLYKEYDYKKMPTSAGVYRFHSKDNVELYVGKAACLFNRILAHGVFLKTLLKEAGETLSISYIVTNDNARIEKEFIIKLKPKYNSVHNRSVGKTRSGIGELVFKAMDGRKQRRIAKDIGIREEDFSKKMKGQMEFTEDEIERINNRLNSNIKK